MTDLDRLDALAAAATPGPWFSHPHDIPGEPVPWSSSVFFTGGRIDRTPRILVARAEYSDAAFIAACDPATIRYLVAAARERDELRDIGREIVRFYGTDRTWSLAYRAALGSRIDELDAALHHKDGAS